MNGARILSTGSVCRVCACTDADACIIHLPTGDVVTDETLGRLIEEHGDRVNELLGACYWVEPDLCSSCAGQSGATAAEAPPLLVDAFGRPLRGAP